MAPGREGGGGEQLEAGGSGHRILPQGLEVPASAAVPEFASLVHGGRGDQGAVVVEQSVGDLCSVSYEGVQSPEGSREEEERVWRRQ